MKSQILKYQTWARASILLGLTLCALFSVAQTPLAHHINKDMTLDAGTYEIEGVHYVRKGATLTIKEGVTLLFNPNSTIRVDGGLILKGSPRNLINITSKNKKSPGNGFAISGVSTKQDISIQYTRFDFIKKPVSFEFRWSRNAVTFSHNIIKRSYYEGAAVEIREIDNLLTEKRIILQFKNNTFCNSTSSLLFSNITSDLLTIDFDNNVITRNEYTGRSRNGLFTSPLYMTYNSYQNNETPTLNNNSIFDNSFSMFYDDTFNIGKTNISVIGNAEKLNLSGNYFGNSSKKEIEESFDFISANYQAPYLYYDNILERPSSQLNGHFYETNINDQPFDEKLTLADYHSEVKKIDLRFNRPVINDSALRVLYFFLHNDTVRTTLIRNDLKWSEGNQHAKIILRDKLSRYSKKGFLQIDGFYDSEGMNVPILTIGQKGILESILREFIPVDSELTSNIDSTILIAKDLEPDTTLITAKDTIEKVDLNLITLKDKYFDVGVFIGNSIYFGDVNRTTVSINPRNMTANGGIRIGYQATENWRYSFRNSYMQVAGTDRPTDDNKNSRGTNFSRNFSFRTTIIDAAFMVEYNFLRFKQKSSFVPSFFTGASVLYFKPMNQINNEGEWYDLRPIGTEGQTLNGADNTYSKITYGIPYGVSIKRHLSQNLIVSLSYTYNKLFTDYLDDTSVGEYPDADELMAANPDLGIKAVQLSNPGDLTGLRSYSDKYDGYGYWGLTFSYKLKK